MRPFCLAIAAAVMLVPSTAKAADGVYSFPLSPSGATGMRWRANGAGEWIDAVVTGGAAIVEAEGDLSSIEIDLLGVPYGRSTIDLTGFGLDTGSVSVTVGEVDSEGFGPVRSVTLLGSEGTATVVNGFVDGVGRVFGVEELAVMLKTEATDRLGVWVRAAVGVLIMWALIRHGLEWVKLAFGGGVAAKPEWKEHRRKADGILEENRRAHAWEDAYESETKANRDFLEDLGYEGKAAREERGF